MKIVLLILALYKFYYYYYYYYYYYCQIVFPYFSFLFRRFFILSWYVSFF